MKHFAWRSDGPSDRQSKRRESEACSFRTFYTNNRKEDLYIELCTVVLQFARQISSSPLIAEGDRTLTLTRKDRASPMRPPAPAIGAIGEHSARAVN